MSAALAESTAQPRTPRGERTLARLLAAAEEVFAEKGFHGASVSDITRRAGVGLGTFYFYFPGKLAIFREVVRSLSRELRRETAAAAAGAGDRVEAEKRAFTAFFRWSGRHRSLYRLLAQAEIVDPALAREYHESIARGYSRVLAEAQARGQVRALDPETLAWCLIGAAEFVNRRWNLWEGKAPPPGVEEAVYQFLGVVLSPEPAGSAGQQRKDRR